MCPNRRHLGVCRTCPGRVAGAFLLLSASCRAWLCAEQFQGFTHSSWRGKKEPEA